MLQEGETSEIRMPEQVTQFEQEHKERYLCNRLYVTTPTTRQAAFDGIQ